MTDSGSPQRHPPALSATWLWALLPARLVLFALVQGLIAAAAWGFVPDPWEVSIRWWPLGITLVNIATILLLVSLYRREGHSFFATLKIDRSRFREDLAVIIGVYVLAIVLAVGPNMALASLLFGSPEAVAGLFLNPLPTWMAAALLVAFPASIALSELPLYFGYLMPRLEAATGRAWAALALPAFFAAAQHVTMPLVFDWRFAAWRLLMFIPFTFFLAAILRWRPRLMPYLVVLHGFLDLSVIAMMF